MLLIHCYPLTKYEVSSRWVAHYPARHSSISGRSTVLFVQQRGGRQSQSYQRLNEMLFASAGIAFIFTGLPITPFIVAVMSNNDIIMTGIKTVFSWHKYIVVDWSLFAGLVSVSLLTDTMQKITCNVVQVTKIQGSAKQINCWSPERSDRDRWETIIFVIVSC